MRCLQVFDKKDYRMCESAVKRIAVRAIIIQDQKIALIKSNRYQECKFPGGGMEAEETHRACLIREVLEETGLSIIEESMKPYGYVLEKRASYKNPKESFEMASYYYFAQCRGKIEKTKLDQYEADLGYALIWLPIDEAIMTNQAALANIGDIATWVERELAVLQSLKMEGLM